MVNLLRQNAAQDRPTVLERHRGVIRNRSEQPNLVVREGRVPVAHELADAPALPTERQPRGVGAGTALGPGDAAVLQHEGRARRVDSRHGRLHDRLERLLEVEGLGDGLGDAGQRLQLGHPLLGVVVQLRVLDRLRDLAGDRHEQIDLGAGELAGLLGTDVERAFEPVAREDGDGENRLVLLLAEVRKALEAWVEVRGARDHDGRALGRGGPGDPLARAHLRDARHVLDPRSARGPEHQLVGPVVVEVDEAGVRLERVGDLARDQVEELAEVERRVDGRDRLGEQPQVSLRAVHRT